MRGRTTALTVTLSPADHRTLTHWQQAPSISGLQARRGRIVLLRAEGLSITTIARWVGLSRRHTYTWIRRYLAQGIEGLMERPRGRAAKAVA